MIHCNYRVYYQAFAYPFIFIIVDFHFIATSIFYPDCSYIRIKKSFFPVSSVRRSEVDNRGL